MKYSILFVSMVLASAACAAGGSQTPVVTPAPAQAQPSSNATTAELQRLLASTAIDEAGTAEYEYRVGGVFLDHVGEVAEDPAAPLLARVHALEIIAHREAIRQYEPVRAALHAADPRVRATALATANSLRDAGHRSATALLREALEDPAPEIQAKALQFVGDEDIVLLRRIASSERPATVLSVANGLLQVLEERGAPLVPDPAGSLARTSATGHSVRFVPSRSWDQWGAAVGRVTIDTSDKRTLQIPTEVEVVANVIPVFFSSDGAYAVYESGRSIHVMNVATGATRPVGAGIAPRVRPFTEDFVFLRADPTGPLADRGETRLSYNVLSAPFTGAVEPAVLGSMGVVMSQSERGNYSPARWMSVAETDGTFYLTNGELVLFRLPNPFGASRN